MTNRRWMVVAVTMLVAAGGLATHTWAGGRGGEAGVDPANFSDPAANAFFPLEPGLVLRYRGSEDGESLRERVNVTERHRWIGGVRTVVVSDVIRSHGALVEKTFDWYAADNDGTVWYFGEATATYDEHGNVESTEGSWEAGVHGAVAGIIMPADPRPGDAYRQEFYAGHAEDQGWIVERGFRTRVPYGELDHLIRSFEWTRLEPSVMAQKVYAPGIGIVRERDLTGGNELLELTHVIQP